MTINISLDYSDLLGEASGMTRNTWEGQLSRYSTYEYYYSGDVFRETISDPEVANPPELYPVGINVVKMLCQSLADATFGEWENLPVWFTTRKGEEENNDTRDASKLLNEVLFSSDSESTFLEMELWRMLYGSSVLRIRPGMNKKVQWLPVKPTTFFPIFDPHDKNRLLKASIVTHISGEQAEAAYGYKTKKSEVIFEEYWDLHKHFVRLDKKVKVSKYSGRNPYGVVPFVYIPRMRSTSTWGDSIATDVIPVQDELNMRLADIGEAVNINTHPTRYGVNLPREFSSKNYPIGSDVLWDLGRSFGENQPEVGVLEIRNPIPRGTFDHVSWLYDWVRTSTFAPPIAFGEDSGGGQRSGVTLEIRMWPLIKIVRKHRSYMRTGLRRAAQITGHILKQKQWGDTRVRVIDALLNDSVEPDFDEVMPRDRAKVVDEVVKRMSTTPPSISLETALKMLSSDSIEEKRIQEMLEKYNITIEEKKEEESKDSEFTQEDVDANS